MKAPALPADEARRLEVLREYEWLDTAPDPELDELTTLVARLCETPISLVTLVDEQRQWFKSKFGLSLAETSRDISFCGHSILHRDLFVVPDASADERFADNPLVTGDPHIRFYAGAPLITPEGLAIGTLSVIDRVPRQLSPAQQETLLVASKQVMTRLELRLQVRKLAKSEERRRLALDSAHLGTFDWDVARNHITWSRGHEALWSFEPGEFAGTYEAFAERVHPHDLPGVSAEVDRCIAAREPFRREFRVIWPDDSVHWIEAMGEFTLDTGGEALRMRGAVLEITERKTSDEALSRSEASLANAQRIAKLGNWDLDIPTQKLFWSEQIYEIFGITKTDFGADYEAFISRVHPQDLERMNEAQRAALAGEAPLDIEHRIVLPDGSVKTVREIGELSKDLEGRPACLTGTVQDVTAYKQVEESHARLATAVEQTGEAIVITDRQGSILYVNPAFERTTGYASAEVLGRNPRILKSGKHDAEHYRQLWELLVQGKTWSGRLVNRRKDGTLFEEEATISPVRDVTGTVVNYVAVKRDVTREMQLEAQFRQSQKMEAIGQLAGGVAHDFNNILAALIMQVELTSQTENLPEEAHEGLQQILAGAERAADLTRQLLLFGRRQVMQPRPVDLNEVVTGLTTMLQRIIGEDVRLQLELHPHPLITVADSGMLDQVLLNLAVNARDAMPGGGRLLIETSETTFTEEEVAAIPDAKPGRHVRLDVTDTGTGISAENLPRIFEPFFTTKEPGKGSGLGLATVFGIVNQHAGSVAVESQLEEGTTVRVFLRADEAAHKARVEATASPKPRGGTETILLVEDEPSVRRLTKIVMERAGYHVLEAPNGVVALEIEEQHHDTIQLLFTDIVMPEGIGGRELADRLQARNPKLKVIFTSGYSADIAGRELSLQEGFDFIQKPCAPNKILEKVRRCLDA